MTHARRLKVFPQRLKPRVSGDISGGAEAPPIRKRGYFKTSLNRLCAVLLLFSATVAWCQQGTDFDAVAAAAAAARDAGQRDEAIRMYGRGLGMRPDWAEGLYYLGTLLYDADRCAEAVPRFAALVELMPKMGPAWTFLGLCEFETKDYAAATKHLERARELGMGDDDPQTVRVALYHLGLLQIRGGAFADGTATLIGAFGAASPPPDVKAALGLALLHVPLLPGEVDPSRDALLQAAGEAAAAQARGGAEGLAALAGLVRSYGSVPFVHLAYSQALAAAGRQTEARAQAQAESKVEPKNASALLAMYARGAQPSPAAATDADAASWSQTMADFSRGRYPETIAALKTWLKRKPEDGTAWAVLGLSEFETGDDGNALIHLERGERLGFGGSRASIQNARYHLGLLLIQRGDFDRATAQLTPEAGQPPLGDEVTFAMGLALLRMPALPAQVDPARRALVQAAGGIAVLLEQSSYDQAFARLKDLLQKYPDVPFLHYAYGTALASLSQYDEAAGQLRIEQRISPRSELPLLRLASIALKQRRPEDGLEPARRAVELAPGSADAHYTLGKICLEMGRTDEAIAELEKARTMSPDSPEVHFSLARAYTRAQQTDKAEQERAEFTRLHALAEEQRSRNGSGIYQGPRDSGGLAVTPGSGGP